MSSLAFIISVHLGGLLVRMAAVLSSLTPATGNSVTAERIAGSIGGFTIDLAAVETPAALRKMLAEHRVQLLFGVHAFRSGRLMLGCGVPYAIILGGTDMNEHLRDPAKRKVMAAALAEARAIVSFNAGLKQTLLEAFPKLRDKVFVIPQAITTPRRSTNEDILQDVTRERLQTVLQLRSGDGLFLLPAGLRPVKDVLWAVRVFDEWHGRDPSVSFLRTTPIGLRVQ